ncbi:GRAM domain-containing protein [Shewanella sp. AS1]|uniref:GRAM domain-containing protein n=1 Tax=Shewanella sp. AS1 TaxID=2907626 RepID=UPI001F239B84|nr:GRAM domain-containing protein [Shewanella sp. AS1]MCE9678547.1 GRAM domain-containing protein [Shewanella sp. AS1]
MENHVLNMEEGLNRTAPCSFQKGAIRVDGVLTLARHQLCFEPYSKSSPFGPYGIGMSQVVAVEPCWGKGAGILPITPDGMQLSLANKENYQFIAADIDEWIALIQAELHQ